MFASFRQQQTIARAVRLEGFGLWSGKDVTLEFRPAPIDHGTVFVRGDLSPPQRVAAHYQHRLDLPRRTVLQAGEARVEMVEHVLAALAGLQVDNCQVWVNGAEMPGLDGSSAPFAAALELAGVVSQSAPRQALVVTRRVRVGDQESWIEARPGRGFHLRYQLDYGPDHVLGRQVLELTVDQTNFCRELAGARTFILKAEAEQLRARGLAERTTAQDVLVFDERGVIDNRLRYPDECVRHKMLDMQGDLALAGVDLVGTFEAYRSGHQLNASLVAELWSLAQPAQTLRHAS